MVVKSMHGRRRYVVYTVPQEVGRNDVLNALSGLSKTMPELRVITSFGGKAIVRCGPTEIRAVTECMQKAYPDCESLICSGTLRKIREIYPELKVPNKKGGPKPVRKEVAAPIVSEPTDIKSSDDSSAKTESSATNRGLSASKANGINCSTK